MQSAGWQLSAEEEVYDRTIRLAAKHQAANLYMVSARVPHEYFEMGVRLPVFNMTYCSSRMVVQLMESSFNFKPIDATPQFVTEERRNIEDFRIFATPLVRTEEIIVEPQSVQECLELIKRLQAPDLAAIRKRNKQTGEANSDAPMQQMQFHAQVLSFAA